MLVWSPDDTPEDAGRVILNAIFGVRDPGEIPLEANALFPVFNEDAGRYEKPDCAALALDLEALEMKRPHRTPLMLDVKRMAVWDGPGLRTAFFVKGCPLKCVWCHNPESIDPQPQEARFQHLCRHCARCTRDEATCPTRAFKVYGRPWTLDAIVAKALEDRPFYDASGGGVTLSGISTAALPRVVG